MAAPEAGTERAGKAPQEMPEAAVLCFSEKTAAPRPQPNTAPLPRQPPTGLPAQGNRERPEGPRAAAASVNKEELIGGGGRHWRSEGASFCSSQKTAMNAILRGRGQRAVVPKRSRSPDRVDAMGRTGAASSADVAEERLGTGRDLEAAAAEQEQRRRREFPSPSKEHQQKAPLLRGSSPSAPWTAAEEQGRQNRQKEALLPWHCPSGNASGEQVQPGGRKQESPVTVEEPQQGPLLLAVPGPSAPGTAVLWEQHHESSVTVEEPRQGTLPLSLPGPSAPETAAREQGQQGALDSPVTAEERQQMWLKPSPAAQGTAVVESEPPPREPLGRFLTGVGGRLLFLGPVQ